MDNTPIPRLLNIQIDSTKEGRDRLKKFMDSLWSTQKEVPFPGIVQGRNLDMLVRNDECVNLGSGVQGDVYAARYLPEKKYVAIKFFYKDYATTRSIFQEGSCLSLASLTCGGARFYGVAYLAENQKYSRYATVSEFIGDSSTFQSTSGKDVIRNRELSDKEVLAHVLKLLKSVYALHEVGLVIGDLKLDNCLYDQDSKTWKVIDMGMSVIEGNRVDYFRDYGLERLEDCHEFLNKYIQVAPETVYCGCLVKKSDVYRIGRILEMTYGTRKDLKKFLEPIASKCLKQRTFRPRLTDVYSYLKSCKNQLE